MADYVVAFALVVLAIGVVAAGYRIRQLQKAAEFQEVVDNDMTARINLNMVAIFEISGVKIPKADADRLLDEKSLDLAYKVGVVEEVRNG